MKEITGLLKTHPAVFAVENEYQIMVPVKEKCLMWVSVDGVDYYDASNGINRSETFVHRMTVPMAKLDGAKKYTLSYKKVILRKPYFPEFDETVSVEYDFYPIVGDKINLYLISDTHNLTKAPIECCEHYKKNKGRNIDLLVLNGDVPADCGSVENFDTVYEIASAITEGSVPTVFSRGNHDLRGIYSEAFAEFTPSYHGATYYTVKLGALWAMILDCGEDKYDSHEEYNGAVSCHSFRLAETEFIKEIIKKEDSEYGAPGVKYRIIISHVPFPSDMPEPFNIEPEIYTEWCKLLRENIKPQLMLAGHMHDNYVGMPGERLDKYGQPCPIVVACNPIHPSDGTAEAFTACAVELDNNTATAVFNDNLGSTLLEETVKL